MIVFDDIKLTRLQLKEVLGCLPNNFLVKERKIYVQGLSEIEKDSFDEAGFIDEKLANLYKLYPEIIVTIQDKVFGIKKGTPHFITHEPCIYDAAKELFPVEKSKGH
jgi:hypothetical protein